MLAVRDDGVASKLTGIDCSFSANLSEEACVERLDVRDVGVDDELTLNLLSALAAEGGLQMIMVGLCALSERDRRNAACVIGCGGGFSKFPEVDRRIELGGVGGAW